MLKIKDDVDLKELEKYGMKPHYSMVDYSTGETTIDYYYSNKYENRYGFLRLIRKEYKRGFIIGCLSRKICNHLKYAPLIIENKDFIDLDLLYDLIKDGLVEKVDE